MAAQKGQAIIFCSCGFFLLLSLFFSSILSGRRLDVYHAATHDVALVRIQNACLKSAVRGSLKIQDAKITQKSPSAHHRTTLSGYIFATKAVVPCQNKIILKNFRPEPPPSVDRPKIILFEHGTTSEMK